MTKQETKKMSKTIKLTVAIAIKEDEGFFRFEDTEGTLKEVATAIEEEIKNNLKSCKSSISRVVTGKPKVIKVGKRYGATTWAEEWIK